MLTTRVLVLDDNPVWTKTLELVLPTYGVEVDVAHVLDKGIEKAKHQPFDAVLLDLSMAQIDDAPVLTRLVAGELPGIPIVILTGRPDPGDEAVAQVIEKGAQDWLSKDATAPAIVRAIRLAIARTKIQTLRELSINDEGKP